MTIPKLEVRGLDVIAQVGGNQVALVTLAGRRGRRREMAERLVAAANAHDELVAALEACLAHGAERGDWSTELAQKVSRALAAAKRET